MIEVGGLFMMNISRMRVKNPSKPREGDCEDFNPGDVYEGTQDVT